MCINLTTACISESCIKIKINLSFYFHTSLWCLKKFYEGLCAPLIRPIKFFLLRLLCISINLPYGHVWVTVWVMFELVVLVATWNSSISYCCPSLAASLESLAHHRNVVSLSLFYRYYFARFSSELTQLIRSVDLIRARSLVVSDLLSLTKGSRFKFDC